ncbi:MAG: DEAD/DEAH box helicase [Acidobacteria bacterium]|nr:DEAD/DEAH box helicase [Acidobacteriota bacterium]
MPGSPARFADTASPLPGAISRALHALGVSRLYAHQAEAIDALRAGRNVVAVTPTASGKSLVYMIPTLERALESSAATALYLFPYKALARDQLRAFRSLAAATGSDPGADAAVYDGDTTEPERRRVRAHPPRVLITNPDMLHLAILAHHRSWAGFLSRLDLVVIDELHVYRGVFGSHLHHVIARLRRLCRHYAAAPRFVACSATIGNPGAFAEGVIGEPFHVVSGSASARSARHFLFLSGRDASPYTLATRAMSVAIGSGLRTIAFTKARRITELIHSWLRQTSPGVADRIRAYRAGYLPEERREIERALGDGRLLGVVSTSALEHGIDVGGLDVCILVGYPGSIASAWQRIGRVGREDRDSLVVLVGMGDALDQYFMTHPGEFFDRGCEPVAADPENPIIASQHLVCAAAELPLTEADRGVYGAATFGLIQGLVTNGALVADHRTDAWRALKRRPERDVSLRSGGAGYTIVEEPEGRIIGSVDEARAFLECHPGAIYLQQGQQYEVVSLDRDRRRVAVKRCDVDYYTQVTAGKETEILEVLETREEEGYVVRLGELRVTQEFKDYARIRIADQRRLSRHPLDLPPMIYETVGLWIEIPRPMSGEWAARGHHFMGSLHAAEHAAISLFPLFAICDRGDIGGISYAHHPQIGGPAIFIYDGYPGGIGLARRGYETAAELLAKTAVLIATCRCEAGCPSCVHSPKCGSGNHPLDKPGSAGLLRELGKPGATRSRVRAAVVTIPERPSRADAAPVRGGARPRRILFFDLETQRSAEEVGGWGRIREMGLALAVTYDSERGEHRTYFEKDADRLAAQLLSADLVVGFNVKRFDYEVLRGCTGADYSRVATLDMLEEIHRRLGFRLSLGHLAGATLGERKSADGLQSLKWWKEGRIDLIEEYCRRDVDVTRALYEFGKTHGYLVYLDRDEAPVRVPVAW